MKNFFSNIKYITSHIIFHRIIIFLFVLLGLLGWANNVNNNIKEKKLDNEINLINPNIKNLNLSLSDKERYVEFRNKHKKQLISFKDLIKKIKNKEVVEATFFAIFSDSKSKGFYVDLLSKDTVDYLNNQTIYQIQKDQKQTDLINTTIRYINGKIVDISHNNGGKYTNEN